MIKYFVFAIIFSLGMMNQETIMAQSNPKPQLNHIAVYVSNLDKSTSFYRDIIGLQLMDEPFKDGLHTWFTLGVQGQLHLIAGAKDKMEHFKDRHLCFSVPSVEDFITILNKHNIVYSDWKGAVKKVNIRADGIKQIYFTDPDGYWIEINDDYK